METVCCECNFNPIIHKKLNVFVDSNGLLYKIVSTDKTFSQVLDLSDCNIRKIGEALFIGNQELRKVVIPEGVSEICDYAFVDCENIESVYLPSSLRVIGDSVFRNCKSLKCINFNNGLEKIGKNSFKRTAIEEVILPKSVIEIGDFCFTKCKNLKRFEILNENTSLGKMIFNGSTNLKDVNCPEKLKRKVKLEMLNV